MTGYHGYLAVHDYACVAVDGRADVESSPQQRPVTQGAPPAAAAHVLDHGADKT